MFSIAFPGPGERNLTEILHSAQFTMMGTVVVEGFLIGRACGALGAGYNPFDLYGLAEQGRGKPLPPHLVFAELEEEDDAACAFLNAYGPLRSPSSVGPLDLLPDIEAKEWKKKIKTSPAPEVYFPYRYRIAPLMPPSLTPQGMYSRTSLEEFWKEQVDFEVTLRLCAALNSAPRDQYRKIKQTLVTLGIDWSIQGRDVERQYVSKAIEHVREQMNERLKSDSPRIVRSQDGTTVAGILACYSLLEAMYLMLFLDIASRNAKMLQCENDRCSRLFYSGRQTGKYCSPECENRDRALRAYHRKKGQK